MTAERVCPIDGNPLIAKGGRPPQFCSVACRRVAEWETRRLNKALEKLEDEHDNVLAATWGSARDRRERQAVIAAAIARKTERMRALFARLEPDPASPSSEQGAQP